MNPTIGRLVHYVLQNGQHRAATVVNAFGGTRANLTVHLDPWNDLYPAIVSSEGGTAPHQHASKCKSELIPMGASNWIQGTLSVGSADNDEDTKAPGTWHWPERE